MEHVYDIIIEGQTIHKAISEELFLDLMSDFSIAYYERGFPDPTLISHKQYIKE